MSKDPTTDETKLPTFCPACGSKIRRSIAERFGIKPDDLTLLMGMFIVFTAILLFTATIVGGIVYHGYSRRAHEADMARQGYVQRARNVEPSTNTRPGRDIVEWVKEEKK